MKGVCLQGVWVVRCFQVLKKGHNLRILVVNPTTNHQQKFEIWWNMSLFPLSSLVMSTWQFLRKYKVDRTRWLSRTCCIHSYSMLTGYQLKHQRLPLGVDFYGQRFRRKKKTDETLRRGSLPLRLCLKSCLTKWCSTERICLQRKKLTIHDLATFSPLFLHYNTLQYAGFVSPMNPWEIHSNKGIQFHAWTPTQ